MAAVGHGPTYALRFFDCPLSMPWSLSHTRPAACLVALPPLRNCCPRASTTRRAARGRRRPEQPDVPLRLLFSHVFWNDYISSPISRVDAISHKVVKSCPCPITRRSNIPVLDRIEMDVIEMIFVVPFITDPMFPKSLLPERNSMTILVAISLCKLPLDDAPTSREIWICFVQGPNAMNVVREKHPRVHNERIRYPTVLYCPAKTGPCRFGCKQRFATGGNDRKEPGPPKIISSISGHAHPWGAPW